MIWMRMILKNENAVGTIVLLKLKDAVSPGVSGFTDVKGCSEATVIVVLS